MEPLASQLDQPSTKEMTEAWQDSARPLHIDTQRNERRRQGARMIGG